VARARGFRLMVGEVLSTNHAMQGLAKKLGFRLQLHPEDATVIRVTLEL
jgi:RimJ/RimL family protein N-acetyltransferase